MKITKYPQSCILIETDNKRILIDPGTLKFKQEFLEDWKDIDIILITHKHADHCYAEAINKIIENKKAKLYATKEVADYYPDIKPEIVKEGDILNFGDIKIEAVKAVHGYIPTLKGEREINENIGYIIDDGKIKAYSTSDTIGFKNDYKCEVLFMPLSNHGLTLGILDGALFAKETGAKLIIPLHYDNPVHPLNQEEATREFQKQGLNLKFLKERESVEI